MKKNVFVKKNLAKKKDPIKVSGLFIILLKQNSTQKQIDVEKAKQQYELYESYKYLNPRYFEIIIPLKEAKINIESSDIAYSSLYNIFRPW